MAEGGGGGERQTETINKVESSKETTCYSSDDLIGSVYLLFKVQLSYFCSLSHWDSS